MSESECWCGEKHAWTSRILGDRDRRLTHPTSDPFDSILKEMSELHARKSRDYGRADDPYANVAASVDFGIPAWVGAMVRANDKVRRIQKAATQATAGESVSLANEGIEDSLLDLATYAIIALVLYRREEN